MRSRYCAYAVGNASYILATTHPDSPHHRADRQGWITEVRAFAAGTTFLGLVVSATEEQVDTASVTFDASLAQAGTPIPRRERSRFYRVGGRWLYHSAE